MISWSNQRGSSYRYLKETDEVFDPQFPSRIEMIPGNNSAEMPFSLSSIQDPHSLIQISC